MFCHVHERLTTRARDKTYNDQEFCQGLSRSYRLLQPGLGQNIAQTKILFLFSP